LFYVTTENDITFDDSFISAPGTYYIFAKRVFGIVGDIGGPSELLTVSIVDVTAPAMPANFVVTSPIDNMDLASELMTVELTWDANTETDFDSYNVYRSVPGGDFELIDTLTTTSYSDDDVFENTTYDYRLSAVDQSGNESGFATGSATTPISNVLPANPLNYELHITDDAINILWERPATMLLSQINSYLITYQRLDTDNSVLETQNYSVSSSTLHSRIAGLTNEHTYRVTIQTVDTLGRASEGLSKNGTPRKDGAPPDPVSLAVTEQGSESGPNSVKLSLSWVPGGDEYETATDVTYRVYFTIAGVHDTQESLPIETGIDQLTLDVAAVPFADENVTVPEETMVTVRITCMAVGGAESLGSYYRLKTSLYASTNALRNVTISYDTRTIRVDWHNNPDTEQIRIRVERRPSDEPYDEPILVSEETVGRIWLYVISRPDLGFTYYVYLTPINENGDEGPTTMVSQITLTDDELALPERPSNLQISTFYKSAHLEWHEPTSDLIEFYRIYRSDGRYSLNYDDYALIDTLTTGISDFTDYGLEDGEAYTYYMTSVDIFGRESLHLDTGYSNVGMISVTLPVYEGETFSVIDATAVVSDFDVILSWSVTALGEPVDSFEILRSIGNLHSFVSVATVDFETGVTDYTYTDVGIITQSNINYFYYIRKISNDAQILKPQTSSVAPDNSICLGRVVLSATDYTTIDTSCRRNIANMAAPLEEWTLAELLKHIHQGNIRYAETINGIEYITDTVQPDPIDLNPSLVVTNWTTLDGAVFTTTEDISSGSIYVVKVDGLFPKIHYEIDEANKQIIFAENVIAVDPETGEISGTVDIELTVLGIEEVTNKLQSFRFDNINAQQIGYSRLVQAQIPDLSHEGRMREQLIPQRTALTRYDNNNFVNLSDSGTLNSALFGEGITFFSITDEASAIDVVSNFDNTLAGQIETFQEPDYAENTQSNIMSGSSGVISIEEAYSGTNSYKATFQFVDDDEGRWLQLSTAGYSPTIDITRQFAVRLMVQSGSFYLGLGIRQSYVANPVIGQDGGTLLANGQEAPIEFVGVTELRESSLDHPNVPTPEGRFLVEAKPGVWQTFEFNIPEENVLAYTGNGTLTTVNGFATLEHLNFTINTDATDPNEEVVVYIDNLVQLTDVIAAGTSQGLQKSDDYGNNWELIRYTETPVHEFYRAVNNDYVWAISAREVYLATHVDNWFNVSGTESIQYIRHIAEDNSGNIYISTDRGVYILNVSNFATFSEFSQTQPINAFTTDTFALWSEDATVYTSTELGVYSTSDLGESWSETSLMGTNEVLFDVISTSSGLLAHSRRKIFRKLSAESQFLEIADVNAQVSTVGEIWKMVYFNGNVYLSTDDGIYRNQTQNMFESGVPTTEFDRIFSATDINNNPGIAYSLDVIGDDLFIGSENILYSADIYDSVTTKREFLNEEAPTVSVNDGIKRVGFLYGAFNGVVSFRESLPNDDIVKVDNLPRQVFFTENGGWAHSDIYAPLLIRENGEAKWVDFALDGATVTTFATDAQANLTTIQPNLNERNSFLEDNLWARTQASADIILEGLVTYDSQGNVETTASLITNSTVAEYLKNYSFLISSINTNIIDGRPTFTVPSFNIKGQKVIDRELTTMDVYEGVAIEDLPYTNTLASIITYADFRNAFGGGYLKSELLGRLKMRSLGSDTIEWQAVQNVLTVIENAKTTLTLDIQGTIEERENFAGSDADGINIDPANGKVDFSEYNTSTNTARRNKFKFSKYDYLTIDIIGATIGDISILSHTDLEDDLERVNSGMRAGLAAPVHGNLIKTGILFERRYPYAFDSYWVQNIQSRYYPTTRTEWYDQVNSTIDYLLIAETSAVAPGRIPFDMHWFNTDPYFAQRLWVATDRDIFEYSVDANGGIEFVRIVMPAGTSTDVRSIYVRNDDEIYTIAGDGIYLSLDFGNSWQQMDTTNLSEHLYSLGMAQNNLLCGTDEGMWWNGSGNINFTRSTLSYSTLLTTTEKNESEVAFVSPLHNLETPNFAFLESKLCFFMSQGGTEFVALGKLGLNSVTVVNRMYYYKNVLWVATDRGLYSDAGTMLSEKVAFNLMPIEGSLYNSMIEINDITGSTVELNTANEKLFCCTSTGKIYQFYNNAWKSYDTSLPVIHKILLIEDFSTDYIIAIGHDQMIAVAVSTFDDDDEVVTVGTEPCLE